MKKLLALLFITALFAVACGEKHDKNAEVIKKDSTVNYTYPTNGQIEFSGILWDVIENTEPEGLANNFNLCKSTNVFVDDRGRLHLRISKIDDEWFGAELQTKTVLGLGDYLIHLDSNAIAIDSNCKLSFSAKSDYNRRFSGMTEAGIRIFGRAIEPPDGFIEYFAYSTEHKFASVEFPTFQRSKVIGSSIYIVSVQSNMLSYAVRLGSEMEHSKYLHEFSVDKKTKPNSDYENRITFMKPSGQMKAIIRFHLNDFDANPASDEVIIVIPRFEFLSPDNFIAGK